jgi:hypothetical protein
VGDDLAMREPATLTDELTAPDLPALNEHTHGEWTGGVELDAERRSGAGR